MPCPQDKKREPAYGTDLLRVWVASVDSSRDVLIGPGILAQTFEGLRKIRNTARFLLGNLGDQPREKFAAEDLGLVRLALSSPAPPVLLQGHRADAVYAQIERYILHELYDLDQTAREAFSTYQFNKGASAPSLAPSLCSS